MPDLAAFARDVSPTTRVAVVGAEEVERNRRFAEEFALPFPVLTQAASWMSQRYKIRSTPFAFYVDADGKVRAKGIVNRLSQLRDLVDRGRLLTPERETTPNSVSVGGK
jgi:hypothetical protein